MAIRRPENPARATVGEPLVWQAERIADRGAEKAADDLIFLKL